MVISRSIIRDLYGGRQMARVMSLTFIVFIMVPIVAPSIGQLVLLLAPWRALFHVFCAFAAAVLVWVYFRLPETLHPEYRMTLTVGHVARAVGKVVADRASLWYTLSVALMFGSVIGYVGMMPQIFGSRIPPALPDARRYSRSARHRWASRLSSTPRSWSASACGSSLRRACWFSSSRAACTRWSPRWGRNPAHVHRPAGRDHELPGLIMANFGAMAMEQMGSVAGIAASLQGCVGTAGGAVVAALMGQRFNGSTLPLALGALLCGLASLGFVLFAEGGRLFRPHQLVPGELAAVSGIH